MGWNIQDAGEFGPVLVTSNWSVQTIIKTDRSGVIISMQRARKPTAPTTSNANAPANAAAVANSSAATNRAATGDARRGNGADPFNLNFEESSSGQLPPGWSGGSGSNEYEIGLDRHGGRGGSQAAFVKAKSYSPSGFGTISQVIRAYKYNGKRLRYSAYVKTKDAGKAQLWMRVDGPNGQVLGFDNMANRPVTDTSDWTKYSCVLDVPPDSASIYVGVLLIGGGEVWIDDTGVEEVGTEVPTTNYGGARY